MQEDQDTPGCSTPDRVPVSNTDVVNLTQKGKGKSASKNDKGKGKGQGGGDVEIIVLSPDHEEDVGWCWFTCLRSADMVRKTLPQLPQLRCVSSSC